MRTGFTVLLSGIAGAVAGAFLTGKKVSKLVNARKKKSDGQAATMHFFNQWLSAKQAGKCLADYFIQNHYKKIMVYGMGYIGERFVDELEESGIEIVAAMDRDASSIFADVPVIGVDVEIPEVDCIVVTPVFYFDEIYHMLRQKTEYPIVSIKDVLEKV